MSSEVRPEIPNHNPIQRSQLRLASRYIPRVIALTMTLGTIVAIDRDVSQANASGIISKTSSQGNSIDTFSTNINTQGCDTNGSRGDEHGKNCEPPGNPNPNPRGCTRGEPDCVPGETTASTAAKSSSSSSSVESRSSTPSGTTSHSESSSSTSTSSAISSTSNQESSSSSTSEAIASTTSSVSNGPESTSPSSISGSSTSNMSSPGASANALPVVSLTTTATSPRGEVGSPVVVIGGGSSPVSEHNSSPSISKIIPPVSSQARTPQRAELTPQRLPSTGEGGGERKANPLLATCLGGLFTLPALVTGRNRFSTR